MPDATIADLSETELLARMLPVLPHGPATLIGPGDDAAVIAAPDGRFVVSTDVLVEGAHFRREWSSGADVGRRAIEQNVADVVAMGAVPTAFVVALALPPDLPVSWVLDLTAGMAEACRRVGAGLVGGDLSSGGQVVVAVTVHGDLRGGAPVLRSGASPGDVLAHAGVLGRSAAGLALLTAGRADADPALVDAFRSPTVPDAAGPAARDAGASAMLDVSDGLVLDASRIAAASGVSVRLFDPRETLAADVGRLEAAATATGGSAVEWVLTGGEDHGLLATFPPGQVPDGFRTIGQIVAAGAVPVVVDGVDLHGLSGWDHFGHAGR
ncbi:MAG: thiamine-phosphate kinase [Cellulomonadaceae bacterium]